jgi:signal transduction histidine kinase
MSATPNPPLLKRVPPGVWLLLAWYAGQIGADFARGWQAAVLWWTSQQADPRLTLGNVLLTAGAAALLRRRPMPAFLLSFAAAVFSSNAMNTQVIELAYAAGSVVALHYVAADCRRLTSIAAVGVVFVVGAGYNRGHSLAGLSGPSFRVDSTRVWVLVLLFAVAWLSGNSVRQGRAHTEALRAQAASQAVTAERLRIARELHDMVAHSIGIIAIQAGVGSRVIETQPAEARNALRAIETTSRDTLSGLRRMLGALRHAEPGQPAEAVPLDPAPGLDAVEELAARTTAAGVRVEVRWSGERRALPAEVELSAYRIVQEAVTNVVRHAGTGYCWVEIDQRPNELALDIVDDGHGAAPDNRSGGYGLVGMRERAALLNGSLWAGNRAKGGFRVTARLPLPLPTKGEM